MRIEVRYSEKITFFLHLLSIAVKKRSFLAIKGNTLR